MSVLICCTCGETKEISPQFQPRFGFEFYKMVQDAGWWPVIDLGYNRTLCFCSEDCFKKQLTKSGSVRKRLLSIPKEGEKKDGMD